MTLARFIAARLLQAILSLLVVLALLFILLEYLGSPIESRLPMTATEQDRQNLIERYGLDDPLPVQYVRYIANAVQGDFGESITHGRPVSEIIGSRLPNTLLLSGIASAFSIAIAIPLGVYSAVKRGKAADVLVRLTSITGQSLPPFWVGLILVWVFALGLGWFPTGGMDGWRSFVLPVITMSLFIAPALLRITRSAMMTILESDYIRFARALNLPERVVIWRYAFRSAAVPIVTYAGLISLATLTGAVITETVFSWPGIGSLAVQTVFNRDFPVIETIVVISTSLYLLVNLLLDIAYGYLDPRIRHGGTS